MPARFFLFYSPTFRRDLDRLPRQAHEKVVEAIRLLESSPQGPHPKIKKLKAKGIGQWRLEVWPYRVRYDVTRTEVRLHRVRHRKEIYRD